MVAHILISVRKYVLLTLLVGTLSVVFSTPLHAQAPSATSTPTTTAPLDPYEQMIKDITDYQNGNTSLDILKYYNNGDTDIYRQIPLTVDLYPEIPGPNQAVEVRIESYATDLNRAQITWTLNGKVLEQGIGIKTFNFTTGNLGVVSNLTITVETSDGNISSQNMKIGPAEVDILWEAQTYTPPFYKGRALPSYQSKIKLVAVPNMMQAGTKISPNTMVYKWKKDGEIMNQVSGFGKSIIYLEDPVPLDGTQIDVEASSLDGTIKATKRIYLTQIAPKVLIYEVSPLKGTQLQSAINSIFNLTKQEIKFAAVPYFYSSLSPKASTKYTWFLNGSALSGQTKPEISFSTQEGQEGTAQISVEARHTDRVFQRASAEASIAITKLNNSEVSF